MAGWGTSPIAIISWTGVVSTFEMNSSTQGEVPPLVHNSNRGQNSAPFILLFDEYYTDQYRMTEAETWMSNANHFVFMGTSFSVNITNIALRFALQNEAKIEIVDPDPIEL